MRRSESDDVEVAPRCHRAQAELQRVADLLDRGSTHRTRSIGHENDFGGRRGVGKVRRKREGDRLVAVGIALDPGLRCIELRGIDEQNEVPVERRIALRQRDRRALAVHGNGHRV